ncbi:peptidoglycan DD-metalloendopeptidase family protein [Congregibacter variabilis]|uniref:Peptidoglycan DD-metalloendopeptidase family protein n=1 Tax=Congregibacter variabilis TaxID=3081200 RepID=A0ABZ0I6B8_9GAMM|nr:peptidoglycan DD-metalloendopeptidase family protein [Congregibacter sp. IMCC43200]
MTRFIASLCLLCISAFMTACADKPLAPIEDRGRPGTAKVEQRYTVLRGDTLFSIAFRYGLDFRRLAAANGISAPFTIFPGQKLRLAEADPLTVVRSTPTVPPKATPSVVAKVPVKQSTPSPGTSSSQSTPKASTPSASSAVSDKSSGNTAKPVTPVSNRKVAGWRWPVPGKVTRRFETNLHKGVDISGKRGDAVIATAGGSVVYAGSGIAGYGLMLIVRHNDEYLSAYGHNDALLVGEGDVVRAGQKIAQRGSSGTDSVKLHFEIRRRGRPVDPLRLLPRR